MVTEKVLLSLLSVLTSVCFAYKAEFDVDVHDVVFKGKVVPVLNVEESLISPPIHVAAGEQIEVNVKPSSAVRDTSIHWHGFEMRAAQPYDGVVGVTQCAIRPRTNFTYNFTVDEIPGTYWYHTHSGQNSGQWHDTFRGPLIVHDSVVPPEALITPYSYDNERILFVADMFKNTPSISYERRLGSLDPVATRGNSGDVVATEPWWGATLNGFESETDGTIINVDVETRYRFRVINGGHQFAFNFSIPGLKLLVNSSDGLSLPCEEPIEVDNVFIWPAERFDIDIIVPASLENSTLSIQFTTLESSEQGYDNHIYGILRVGNNAPNTVTKPRYQLPPEPAVLNCYKGQISRGTCLSLSSLNQDSSWCKHTPFMGNLTLPIDENAELNFIDFKFIPQPQGANLVRVNDQTFVQHVNPFLPLLDAQNNESLHPSSVVLDLALDSTVIMIMRTTGLMSHPMHIHGHRFEVLDQYSVDVGKECSILMCNYLEIPEEKIKQYKSMPYTGLLKDTVVLPAGGALVVRFKVDNPGAWLVHCHLDNHRDDGMAFIIRERLETISEAISLPHDYPECLPISTQIQHPSCNCFEDTDALQEIQMNKEWTCSREHLCHHQLDHFPENFKPILNQGIQHQGLAENSIYISLSVFIIAFGFYFFGRKLETKFNAQPHSCVALCTSSSDNISFISEFMNEWKITHKDMVNSIRLVEVVGLAIMTGITFFEVGKDSTNRGLRECISLLFFSVTLWTFTRMYPAIPAHHSWRERVFKRFLDDSSTKTPSIFALAKISLARSLVYFCGESIWPIFFGVIAFPIAHLNNKMNAWFQIILFLLLNNMCYIAFGSIMGTLVPMTQIGMISSTIYSQTSLICAGFYRTLPPFLRWFKYISFVFYTYSGIVKSVFEYSDSYSCRRGDGRVGEQWCLIETSLSIEDMQIRGIDAADSGNQASGNITLNIGMLAFFYFFQVVLMIPILYYKLRRKLMAESENKKDQAINMSNLSL